MARVWVTIANLKWPFMFMGDGSGPSRMRQHTTCDTPGMKYNSGMTAHVMWLSGRPQRRLMYLHTGGSCYALLQQLTATNYRQRCMRRTNGCALFRTATPYLSRRQKPRACGMAGRIAIAEASSVVPTRAPQDEVCGTYEDTLDGLAHRACTNKNRGCICHPQRQCQTPHGGLQHKTGTRQQDKCHRPSPAREPRKYEGVSIEHHSDEDEEGACCRTTRNTQRIVGPNHVWSISTVVSMTMAQQSLSVTRNFITHQRESEVVSPGAHSK